MTVILALIHDPAVRERLIQDLPDGFTVRWLEDVYPDDLDAVATIADQQAALMILELDQPLSWLNEVRMNPATRRLPVIALAHDEATQQRAVGIIAAAIYTPSEFMAVLPDMIIDYARIFDQQEALDQQCGEKPPPLVLQGLHEFNAGEYFECHESLEHAWMADPGPVRELYRAILQISVAYLQIVRGNYRGALKMFLRSRQWFATLPDSCQGIDVATLRADAAAARAHLEALGPERMTEYDRSLLKPIIYQE
jgi:predicted metal-dependent hydrolase